MKKGLLIVHTGDGKGKTTAALGMALRAAGHGLKVCFIQFIKGSWKYGEMESIKKFRDTIEFHVLGKGFTWKSKNPNTDIEAARQAWAFASEAINTKPYHMVVLDEFTYPLSYKMIDLNEVLKTLAAKPADQHVIVTGRNAPDELIKAADLVTEMQAVKHPFKEGIKAQKGIEF